MEFRGKIFFGAMLFLVAPSIVSFSIAQSNDDAEALQLEPREPFALNLPKIQVNVDDETGEFDGVKITFPQMEDQVYIGVINDMYIKNSSRGSEKTLYRELPEKAGIISKFEAKYIGKVDKSFVDALDILEKLLQNGQWRRCLYFDSYFPHFLKGYYYLISAARNSERALRKGALVPDEEYDVSLNSPKTDDRIGLWRSSPDQVIKLRIAGKELAYQLKAWQKIVDKIKDNEDVTTPRDLEDALVIFTRVYFNLKPPLPVVLKKQR